MMSSSYVSDAAASPYFGGSQHNIALLPSISTCYSLFIHPVLHAYIHTCHDTSTCISTPTHNAADHFISKGLPGIAGRADEEGSSFIFSETTWALSEEDETSTTHSATSLSWRGGVRAGGLQGSGGGHHDRWLSRTLSVSLILCVNVCEIIKQWASILTLTDTFIE